MDHLSVEFVNVGGWLTNGDMALIPSPQFLAVAEHRLIPAMARSMAHQLRKAGLQSVWAPACQDQIPGGHAGVGVISLHGAPLCAPSLITPDFLEFFFGWGRTMRVTVPTGTGCVVHLFVVYGHQGAEEVFEKRSLTDKLLNAVLSRSSGGLRWSANVFLWWNSMLILVLFLACCVDQHDMKTLSSECNFRIEVSEAEFLKNRHAANLKSWRETIVMRYSIKISKSKSQSGEYQRQARDAVNQNLQKLRKI